jgi:hypothetical protein
MATRRAGGPRYDLGKGQSALRKKCIEVMSVDEEATSEPRRDRIPKVTPRLPAFASRCLLNITGVYLI